MYCKHIKCAAGGAKSLISFKVDAKSFLEVEIKQENLKVLPQHPKHLFPSPQNTFKFELMD